MSSKFTGVTTKMAKKDIKLFLKFKEKVEVKGKKSLVEFKKLKLSGG